MIEPDLNVVESHKLIHDIQEKIQKEVNEKAQVIIHLEPFEEQEEKKQ